MAKTIRYTTIVALAVAIIASAVSVAQEERAKPNLPWPMPATSFSPPRLPDGTPNFQGNWANGPRKGTPTHSLEDGADPVDSAVESGNDPIHAENEYANVVVDPPDGRIPYQPWALARRMEMLRNMATPTKWSELDIDDRCLPNGTPRTHIYQGMKIVQRTGSVVFLQPYLNSYRVIPTDGRPPLRSGLTLWMGDSRGRWEGNTLVVEVANHNAKAWLDGHATFYSNAMRLVERWTMISADELYYEATIEDPTVFTRPWKIALTYDRGRDVEQWEHGCYEGVKLGLMLDVGRRARAAGSKDVHWHPRPKEE